MWKLVIEDDEGKRTVVPLTRDDYTIGRQEGNTIRLTERNVSREHGRIKRKRNGAPPVPSSNGNGSAKDNFVLEDRSSYNGLFVNGLRVAHTQDLQHGDLIQIGDYRIVLQDDAASAIETAAIPITTTEPGHDAKATIPMAAAFRGQDLTDRPSRFVMLVGPTPGVEYPLERERMTIGRAEDSSISVNHNSVSRLHCEVHALGDGRYEIVDKGSSNGVRVNAVELKRSIIEAGDVIELGDVRFKFVGAGQVFVPGPNESQQLTAISDREAELADPRRKSWGGYALPIVGAGLVGALIILAFVWVLRARASDTPPGGNITTTPDTEQALVTEAKKSCTPDDCDVAYQQISTLPDKSPWRSHKDFRYIENMWADSMFKKVASTSDVTVKRAMLAKVGAATTLDEAHRAKLAAALADLDQPAATPSQLPIASTTPPVTPTPIAAAVTAPPPSAGRPPQPAHTTAVTAPATTTQPAVTTPPTVKPPAGPSALERAVEAAAEGRSADVRRLLESKVRAGHGTADEVRLVRKACSSPYDKACVDDIKAKYPP